MSWLAENYMSLIWLAVIVCSAVAEGMTLALVSVWFIPAGAVSLIVSLFHVKIGVQIAVFLVLSAALVALSRTVFKEVLRIKPVATNADALIGERALVTERISNVEEKGAVRVHGLVWTARSAGDETFEAGETVHILRIEGVKLIVTK